MTGCRPRWMPWWRRHPRTRNSRRRETALEGKPPWPCWRFQEQGEVELPQRDAHHVPEVVAIALHVVETPPLGCPKCRRAPKGCGKCRRRETALALGFGNMAPAGQALAIGDASGLETAGIRNDSVVQAVVVKPTPTCQACRIALRSGASATLSRPQRRRTCWKRAATVAKPALLRDRGFMLECILIHAHAQEAPAKGRTPVCPCLRPRKWNL